MAVVINTNVDAIKIRHDLTKSTNGISTAMERMATGLKVLTAKDDAAGTVISARMKVQLEGNLIAQNNVQNGNAMLATAEGNLDVVQDNLSRIRDLTLQAKNGTYSKSEIQAMQDEVDQLVLEIDRVSTSSKFSSLKLFEPTDADADAGTDLQKDGAVFQVGANSPDDNTIVASADLFQSVRFSALTGIGNGDAAGKVENRPLEDKDKLDLTALTKEEMAKALDALDMSLDNITGRKSIIGSAQNRLDSALASLTNQYENLSTAKSLITDSDIASEASDFTQNQILQQVATSLLSQANQIPAIALSLV